MGRLSAHSNSMRNGDHLEDCDNLIFEVPLKPSGARNRASWEIPVARAGKFKNKFTVAAPAMSP
jgi:hypothetical protein